MKPTEKQYIEEEYNSKKPFTVIIMIIVTLAWLLSILTIVYTVNAVAEYTFNLFQNL